jgi:hypothetical protein
MVLPALLIACEHVSASGAVSAGARGCGVPRRSAGGCGRGRGAGELGTSAGGDLPAAGRARAGQHETLSVQQPQRLGDQIAAAMPRVAAQGGDLTGADRLAVMRVLGIAQRGQHRSMLTGHAPNATGLCGHGRRRRGPASPPAGVAHDAGARRGVSRPSAARPLEASRDAQARVGQCWSPRSASSCWSSCPQRRRSARRARAS